MKLIEVGRDDISGGERLVIDDGGAQVVYVMDRTQWREERTGSPMTYTVLREVEQLLWVYRREEARKAKAEGTPVLYRGEDVGIRVYPNGGGYTVTGLTEEQAQTLQEGGSLDQGLTTFRAEQRPYTGDVTPQVFAERAAPTLPPELSGASPILEGLGEALAHAQGEDIGATEWRRGPGMPLHDGGTLTAEEFAQAQDGVHTGEAVLTQRAIETMGAVLCGAHPSDPREVYVPRAVTVALVEAPENVVVRGLAPAHEVFVDTGRQFPWVSLEASTEGLRKLHEVIGAELRRREEGT